jgi:DNA replication ATP-dependent helicase Dna2
VLAATASFLAQGDHDDLLGRFDLVIIDEATQLSVPATLGPLRFAKRFVLVGDPNQLPPVRVSRDSVPASDERADSLFELLAERVRSARAEGLVELENQYRMNDTICRLPSDMWYSRTLRPGTDGVARARLSLDASRLSGALSDILDPARPVVFVDVAPDFSRGLRLNLSEASWVARIVAAVHAHDPVFRDPAGASTRIGVLAPFRAQVACIRRALEEHLPGVRTSTWVDTVDRFQGDERDLMVFSLVGGRGWHVPVLLADPRRLNVALSRARHKLILIGDHAFLSRTPLFQQLFEVITEAAPDYLVRPTQMAAKGV